MKAFIRKIRNLLPADGSGAAILIGHTDKATAKKPNTSQGYSGSTGWNNSVRARWYLRPDLADDERLILELAKSNYGPAGAMMALRWSNERGIHLRENIAATAESAVPDECRAQLLQMFRTASDAGAPIPAARSGPRTTIRVLTERGLPAALSGKSNKRKLAALIERMRQDDSLHESEVPGSDRHPRKVLLPAAGVLDACGNSQNSRNPGEIPAPAGILSGGCGGTFALPQLPQPDGPTAVGAVPNDGSSEVVSNDHRPTLADASISKELPRRAEKRVRKSGARKQAARRVVGDPGRGGKRSTALPSA